MSFHIPVVIIGGGVIGLAIANELSDRGHKDKVCVLDKEIFLGEHSSGRNSGVLHAGLYYPKNSLKKRFCVDGLKLWRKFCSDNNLFYRNCGKFIFTTYENESALALLFERARNNGVEVRRATDNEIQKLGKFCRADLGFYSPRTSIIDPSEVIHFLKNKLESLAVPIMLNQSVKSITRVDRKYKVKVDDYEFTCDFLINAAGHGAVGVRRLLGLSDLEQAFVKGHYVKLNKTFYNDSLLYPLPEENLKGLGVHSCIDSDGSVKFGPDTKDEKSLNYSMDNASIELMKDKVLKHFLLDRSHLYADFAGVRSRVLKDGNLIKDFLIQSPIDNYFELIGVESPGLTSSLSIAKYISDKIGL